MKRSNNNRKTNKKESNSVLGNKPKLNFWEFFETLSKKTYVIGIFLIVVSYVFNTNYSKVYDRKLDLGGDNIVYYSLGQALSHGEGYSTIYSLEKKPHTHFPPGYPYFISKLIKIFPENIYTVKKANGFLLYCSVLILFFIILVTTRSSILAFCACILVSMHKELLRYATIMMSEPLFIFLSLTAILIALLLASPPSEKKRTWLWWIGAVTYGTLVASSYMVRTMGLSLVFALIGWLIILAISSLIKKRKTQSIRCLLLCLITIIAVGSAKLSWDTRNRNLGVTTGSEYKNTFFKKTNNEDMEGTEDWKVRIKSNTSNFITRWIPEVTYMKEPVDTTPDNTVPISKKEWIMGILILALLISGCLYLKSGRVLMLLYIGLTVGVLILYPEQFGGTRYITPIIPLLVFLMLNGLSAIVAGIQRLFTKTHSPLLFQSVIIILVTFLFLKPKYAEAQKPYQDTASLKSWLNVSLDNPTNINMRNYLLAARYCGDSLPDNARILCRKPEIYYMYSNYRHANKFPNYAEPDTIYNLLCRDSINYLIVDNWYRHARVTLVPCIQKYDEKFQIVKQIGEVDTINHIYPTYVIYFNDYWGYHGELKDGIREGEGVLNQQNGNTYVGTFANGLPNGQGTYYDSTGNVIATGIWHDGSIIIPMR